MEPIGYIRSGYKTREGIAPQSKYASEETAAIEMLEEYKEGIADILPGTYGIILFYFHKSDGYKLRPPSRRSDVPSGVFSTRSPHSPNGIGMSIVEFTENDGKNLTFKGVDMLDGTPVLDIKPYSADLNPDV
jgi:tRNA-Thr(GGU) m(6)t(6)A37 methyltransferase TsaA